MNFFNYFIKGTSRRSFLKTLAAAVAAGNISFKVLAKDERSETVVEELPEEVFLHGSGISIPH